MTQKRMLVGICVLLIGIFAAISTEAGGTKLKGTLYSLSGKNHTVTLKDATGKLQTLNVGAAKLKRNGSTAALNGLVIGDRVAAQFPKGVMNPKKLKAAGPKVTTISGALQNVHSSSSSVQVGGKSYKATSKTRLIRNGKVVSLSKLTRHDSVTVHVSSSGDCEDIDSEGPDDAEVRGVISSVDTGASTITITPDDGSPDVTLTVTADTEIELDGEDVALSDLVAGETAEAEYDPATMVAFSIDAESPDDEAEIHGAITAIDLGLGTVTVQDETGNSVTVTVTASTEISLDEETAFLADLAVGDQAHVEYNTLTMEANSIDAKSPEDQEIEGVITAVDAGAGTVTISGEGEDRDDEDVVVTLSIDVNTQISLDDAPATLSDLSVGDEADASYNGVTLVASEIDASSETEDDAPVHMSPARHSGKIHHKTRTGHSSSSQHAH